MQPSINDKSVNNFKYPKSLMIKSLMISKTYRRTIKPLKEATVLKTLRL
jgi:hypothetical protein